MAINGEMVIELDKKRMQAMTAMDIATLDALLAGDPDLAFHGSGRHEAGPTKRSLAVTSISL